MIDQTTPHFALPKPHPDNALEDDVLRLRACLDTIDGVLHWAAQRVDSDDPLGSVSALVAAVTDLRADVVMLIPSGSTTVSYNASGQVSSLVETLPGGLTRTTVYTYTGALLTRDTVTLSGAGDPVAYRTDYGYVNNRLTSSSRTLP